MAQQFILHFQAKPSMPIRDASLKVLEAENLQLAQREAENILSLSNEDWLSVMVYQAASQHEKQTMIKRTGLNGAGSPAGIADTPVSLRSDP